MIKFPSIEQYRNVIRSVQQFAQFVGLDGEGLPIYNKTASLPTLKFIGTVKLHGTNAGIIKNVATDELSFQSRERELTLTDDNAGFASAMHLKATELNQLIAALLDQVDHKPDHVAVFGEWCGGSIQKGVALSNLAKMFVVFKIKFLYADESENVWLDLKHIKEFSSPACGIYNIFMFPSFEIDIDFEHPEEAQNKMIEITNQVEIECPVGKYFDVSGVGEGVVWSPADTNFSSSKFWFKVKGEKHSSSKVKTLAAIDIESVRAINDFVELSVTDMRLEQGLNNLVNEQQKLFDMTSMGDFIRWVFNDVVKEEHDTLVGNGFDPKKLGGPIANKARKWYINKLNSGV